MADKNHFPVCIHRATASNMPALDDGEIGWETDTERLKVGKGGVNKEPNPKGHAASHTDGTDDIQDATASQKGLATAAQITALAANTAHRNATSGNPHNVSKSDVGLGNVTNEAQIAKSLGTAKGDIIVYSASGVPIRLAKSTNGYVLTLDDAQTGGLKWAEAAGGDDEKAKVSSNDTTAGYLNGKLVAGDGIDLTENSDGGNETLTVAAESATTSNPGISELATSAEVTTGTDTERAVTPAALAGSHFCRIKLGTYTGNGSTGQAITGAGFAPIYGIIWLRITGESQNTRVDKIECGGLGNL